MSSAAANPYHPERLEKIQQIIPSFLDFARPGDEIELGLDGDPSYPVKYRGANGRPKANVVEIEGPRGSRVLHAKLQGSGRTIELAEDETSAQKVWQFTDAGYNKVLARTEAETAMRAQKQAKEAEYRGILSKGGASSADMKQLRGDMQEMKQQMGHLHGVVCAMAEGLSHDVSRLSQGGRQDAVFANQLIREMATYRGALQDKEGAASTSYRGAKKAQAPVIEFSDEEDLSE